MEKEQPKQWNVDEKLFEKAAQTIKNAHYLLVGAGAGMSADSGLAVYGDVSNMKYFKENNLTYRDVSDPRLLAMDPELFFGWTAANVDKYRTSQPHPGYHLLRRWCETLFETNRYTEKLRNSLKADPLRLIDPKDVEGDPAMTGEPKNYFVFTTNVDSLFLKADFPPSSVCQTHGTYARVQCSGLRRGEGPEFKLFDGPCVQKIWVLPKDFEFVYSEDSMNAPAGPPKCASLEKGFTSNHPTCPYCGKLARPNVYQFGDQCFVESKAEEAHLTNWIHAVEKIVDSEPEARLVLLEIGVGMRLPKIRICFERILKKLPEGRATIIRVNPEYSSNQLTEGLSPENLISIPSGALFALQSIDSFLEK